MNWSLLNWRACLVCDEILRASKSSFSIGKEKQNLFDDFKTSLYFLPHERNEY